MRGGNGFTFNGVNLGGGGGGGHGICSGAGGWGGGGNAYYDRTGGAGGSGAWGYIGSQVNITITIADHHQFQLMVVCW